MKIKQQNHLRVIAVCIMLLGFSMPAVAQLIPGDLMANCAQWKITKPDGTEQKPLCAYDNQDYYYVNDTDDGIVFRVEINEDNESTENSDYIRSELRERLPDGSADIYWTTTGQHVIYVEQAITHLPTYKDHLVATQIHGNKDDGIDDAMVLRLEGTKLFLSFNGGKLQDDLPIKNDYVLGTKHEVIFEVIDGKHYCYYSEAGGLKELYDNGSTAGRAAASGFLIEGEGGEDYVMDLDYDESYFKVGNYTQSNRFKEAEYAEDDGETYDPDALNYGEVVVYDFSVIQDGEVDGDGEGGTDPGDGGGETPAEDEITILSAVGVGTEEGKTNVSAPYAFDGVVDTGYYWAANADLGEASITFDLGCNRDLTGIGVYFAKSDARTTNFDVSISNDGGASYTDVISDEDSATTDTDEEELFDLTGENGQFVKITGYGNNGGSGWVSILEVNIYGDVSDCATLGTEDFESLAGKGVRLFPVPTSSGVLNITSANAGINGVAIYNIYGQKVLASNANNVKSTTVNVSALSKGTYFVILEGIGSSKFVVN